VGDIVGLEADAPVGGFTDLCLEAAPCRPSPHRAR
jgi:hypothetical protein